MKKLIKALLFTMLFVFVGTFVNAANCEGMWYVCESDHDQAIVEFGTNCPGGSYDVEFIEGC